MRDGYVEGNLEGLLYTAIPRLNGHDPLNNVEHRCPSSKSNQERSRTAYYQDHWLLTQDRVVERVCDDLLDLYAHGHTSLAEYG